MKRMAFKMITKDQVRQIQGLVGCKAKDIIARYPTHFMAQEAIAVFTMNRKAKDGENQAVAKWMDDACEETGQA